MTAEDSEYRGINCGPSWEMKHHMQVQQVNCSLKFHKQLKQRITQSVDKIRP